MDIIKKFNQFVNENNEANEANVTVSNILIGNAKKEYDKLSTDVKKAVNKVIAQTSNSEIDKIKQAINKDIYVSTNVLDKIIELLKNNKILTGNNHAEYEFADGKSEKDIINKKIVLTSTVSKAV